MRAFFPNSLLRYSLFLGIGNRKHFSECRETFVAGRSSIRVQPGRSCIKAETKNPAVAAAGP